MHPTAAPHPSNRPFPYQNITIQPSNRMPSGPDNEGLPLAKKTPFGDWSCQKHIAGGVPFCKARRPTIQAVIQHYDALHFQIRIDGWFCMWECRTCRGVNQDEFECDECGRREKGEQVEWLWGVMDRRELA